MKPRIDFPSASPSAVFAQHDADLRRGAVGDPHLGAVEDPRAVLLLPGAGDHPGGVRAVVGLGEAEAADDLALRHPRQPFHLLLFAAERVDGIHHERALHRRERADAGVAALELLHDEPVADVVQPRAAVFLGEVRAEHAELGHRRDELLRESALDVLLADDREDLFVDEAADGVADRALFFGERGVDVEKIAVAGLELGRGEVGVVVVGGHALKDSLDCGRVLQRKRCRGAHGTRGGSRQRYFRRNCTNGERSTPKYSSVSLRLRPCLPW